MSQGAPVKISRLLPAAIVAGAFFAVASPHAQTPISMPGYPAVGAPPTVTLLSAGAEPRKQLRYTIAAGAAARMDVASTINLSMTAAGVAFPIDLPKSTMVVDLTVTSVAPNGDITYNMAFTEMSSDGPVTNPIAAPLLAGMADSVKSIKGTTTISNRGITKSSKLDAGDPATQLLLGQLMSSVGNPSMPFPEEAVGVGAKWEVRQALSGGGQTKFEKATYELVSIDGSTVSLKSTIEQTAPAQSVSNPMLPAGTELSLEKLTGTGSGTATIRLDSLVPTSQTETTITMTMSTSMGGATAPITSELKSNVSIAPKAK